MKADARSPGWRTRRSRREQVPRAARSGEVRDQRCDRGGTPPLSENAIHPPGGKRWFEHW